MCLLASSSVYSVWCKCVTQGRNNMIICTLDQGMKLGTDSGNRPPPEPHEIRLTIRLTSCCAPRWGSRHHGDLATSSDANAVTRLSSARERPSGRESLTPSRGRGARRNGHLAGSRSWGVPRAVQKRVTTLILGLSAQVTSGCERCPSPQVVGA